MVLVSKMISRSLRLMDKLFKIDISVPNIRLIGTFPQYLAILSGASSPHYLVEDGLVIRARASSCELIFSPEFSAEIGLISNLTRFSAR